MERILTSLEFHEKYEDKLEPGQYKFIVAAFNEKEETVAIYPDENKFDCFFQLPSYKTKNVPNNRRFIYKLNKNTIQNKNYRILSDGRYKIDVKELEVWDDPYAKEEDIVPETEVKTKPVPNMEDVLIKKVNEVRRKLNALCIELNGILDEY
jgi:hypothetical protein